MVDQRVGVMGASKVGQDTSSQHTLFMQQQREMTSVWRACPENGGRRCSVGSRCVSCAACDGM